MKSTKKKINSRSTKGTSTKISPTKYSKKNAGISKRFEKKGLALLFVVLFAAIGSYFLIFAKAETVLITRIEAETLQIPTGGRLIEAADLSGAKAVSLDSNGSLTGTFSLLRPVSTMVIRANGASCKPSVQMVVHIDEVKILETGVSSRNWTDISAAVNLSADSHRIAVSYTNDSDKKCQRSLGVDVISFYGTVDTSRPTQPVLTAVPGNSEVDLSWTSAKDDVGLAKYQVWQDDRYLATTAPTANTYKVTGLVNGTTYRYRVVASDAAGNYINSNTVSATPNATATPTPSHPSGQAMPVGDVTSGGHTWRQIVAEDFTKDAPIGSWDDEGTISSCPFPQQKIVYTGATGVAWKSYPKCYKDTYQKRPYRADRVLSVHDGVLDFWLRNVDGQPAGANPSPVLPGGSQYQTYGRYEARFRITNTTMAEYYTAWLLWPENSDHYKCSESDFPESPLNTNTVKAFHHYGSFVNNTCSPSPAVQDVYTATVDKTQWHTYTQEWMPGRRNYYVDGVLIGSSTNAVWDKPQRWQLQTETNGYGSSEGHLEVDWVTVYAY